MTNVEHWIEMLLIALGIISGISVWAFGIEARVRVLERSFQEHVEIQKEALAEVKHDLQSIKENLEQVAIHCLSCRHYTRATLAGQVEEEP